MQKKINVLFMQSQSFFGADSMIHSLLMRYYNRSRLEVHVACNPGTPSEKSAAMKMLETIPDLHLHPTNFGPQLRAKSKVELVKNAVLGLPGLTGLVKLAWYVKRHRIDVIHCTEKPRDAFYGLLLARLTGAKCVIHLHVKVEGWLSPLVRWAMRHADGLIAISDFVAQSAVELGYPASKIHVVHNSLDASLWDYRLEPEPRRAALNIPSDARVMMIISRLFHWKGHTLLLKALAKVKVVTPDFKLVIVGEDDPRGAPGRGSYRAELEEMVAEFDLGQQVIFTGFRKDINQLLAAADLYVMPSFEEPFGVVFLEAMAMQKPVIALNNGGTPEVVEDGVTGLLSAPDDIEALAANILELLNNPARQTKMGQAGRARVEQCFNPQLMADRSEQVYRQLLQLAPSEVHLVEASSVG